MRTYKPTKSQKAFVQKWLDRLRNKRSRQYRGALKGDSGYCCLGHACMAVGKRFRQYNNMNICEGENTLLPESVATLLGVSKSPYVTIGEGEYSLWRLNDYYKFSLKEIADAIEADWIKGTPLKSHPKI